MNHVVAVAGSRGRIAIVATEVIETSQRRPIKLVRLAERFSATAGPDAIAREVLEVVDSIRTAKTPDGTAPDGRDPRVVISAAVHGGAVLNLLREAKESGVLVGERRVRLVRNPLGITTYASAADGSVEHVAPNRLASVLYTEYDSRRLEFAPGLDRLKRQLAAFVPVETKVGNLAFGNEDMSDYDDMTVALMHAVIASKGSPQYGIPRFRDQSGFAWPSRQMARAHVGQAAR